MCQYVKSFQPYCSFTSLHIVSAIYSLHDWTITCAYNIPLDYQNRKQIHYILCNIHRVNILFIIWSSLCSLYATIYLQTSCTPGLFFTSNHIGGVIFSPSRPKTGKRALNFSYDWSRHSSSIAEWLLTMFQYGA